MRSIKLSRRTALRGAGVTIALPWLEAMAPTTRRAYAAAAPKRFLVFFSPNGTIREAWTPTGGTMDFQLSRILAPLEPHRGDIVVLDGVDAISAGKGPGDDHMRGMGSMLTGTELLNGNTMGGAGAPSGLAGGISVDQELVGKLKSPTKFPSLELGVLSDKQGTVWGYTSYKAAGQPLPPDNSPRSVFDRVFTTLTTSGGDDGGAAARLRAEQKSVLNAVMDSYRRLEPRLGREDRAKLDQHLTAIGELEKRVSAGASTTSVSRGCAKPAPIAALDFNANDNFPKTADLQADLLVMALACDLTRVGTLQHSRSFGGPRFTWLGQTRGHHDISHDSDDNADSKEMLTKVSIWYAGQFNRLLDKLAAVPEAGGTLLDNTLVLWCNELSRGNSHSHPDMPYVLAGRAGGRLKTGRLLKFTGNVPHNNLLVSILNAMDVPATTFGNPAYCSGSLTGLL